MSADTIEIEDRKTGTDENPYGLGRKSFENDIVDGDREEIKNFIRSEIKRPHGDYFSCAAVMEFFCLSPARMVETLREYKDIIGIYSDELTFDDRCWFYDENNDSYNCVHLLDKARFHYLEVRSLRLFLGFGDKEEIEAILKRLHAKLKEFGVTDLHPLDFETKDPALTSQQKASLVRQENALNALKTAAATEALATAELARWKDEYAPAMVKVALRCGEEGKKKRQSSEFVKLFEAAGATLSKKKLALFRGWLPDEHTDRDGGAPTQD